MNVAACEIGKFANQRKRNVRPRIMALIGKLREIGDIRVICLHPIHEAKNSKAADFRQPIRIENLASLHILKIPCLIDSNVTGGIGGIRYFEGDPRISGVLSELKVARANDMVDGL